MAFFYDNQIRRHLEQFIRLFSDLNVYIGKDANGIDTFQRVPARYGDSSRMAGHILKNNSENFLNSVPLISCYIERVEMNANRRLNPTYQDKVQVYERPFDKETNTYGEGVGSTYTIIRHMPVPYDLSFSVDVWTSNTDQKHQLFEQIGTMFNPGVNIRSSSNVFDWSALTYVEMKDVTLDTRTIPQGADSVISVTSWKFLMPIWLNPPAKVKRQVLIHTIINRLKTVENIDQPLSDIPFNDLPTDSTQFTVITHEDRKISIEGNKVSLLNSRGTVHDDSTGQPLNWAKELELYGGIKTGVSHIRLHRGEDFILDSQDIIGTIELDADNENLLTISIDNSTVPGDTIAMVMGVIDPTTAIPGEGILPPAAVGQRYLIVDDFPSGSAWGTQQAKAGDIVEFNGNTWAVAFSSTTKSTQYVTNANTMVKYQWTGSEWIDACQGVYNAGYWRLYL